MVTNHKLVCARAARQEYAEAYRRGIGDYRGSRRHAVLCARHFKARFRLPPPLTLAVFQQVHDPSVVQLAWDGAVTAGNAPAREQAQPFRVLARLRPLLPEEREASAYASLSTEDGNNAVVVHDGRVHRDGRTLYMVHSRFCLDRVFGADEPTRDLYADACQPLLQAALAGKRATLLLFGQTGTGKTYTARGLLEHLCPELFSSVDAVNVLCYEIAGTRGGREEVFDLLAERKAVKCLTGEDDQVHVRGARSEKCCNVNELDEALRTAFAWRSSESTERNEASSRSHAVVELQLPAASDEEQGGVLRIVDLAGSERNFETQLHTRKMAERGGHINYSISMLKECARIMHRNRQRREDGEEAKLQHIPFRGSRLTHLLRNCFTDEAHRTAVIATLSPAPVDVEHSLNSLQHVGMMRAGRPDGQAPDAGPQDDGGQPGSSFGKVEGRGHGLHSKLQDARREQLNLHAFGMVTGVGGTVMKRYEPENVKTEAFIDPRWHREMKVVAEKDLWVLREADAEVVQVLTEWKEEQWQLRKAHDISRWDAATLAAFLASLDLPGRASLPPTMTGSQLLRLGRRGLTALCSDEATAEALHAAVLSERQRAKEAVVVGQERNAKMTALGANKVHAALD